MRDDNYENLVGSPEPDRGEILDDEDERYEDEVPTEPYGDMHPFSSLIGKPLK